MKKIINKKILILMSLMLFLLLFVGCFSVPQIDENPAYRTTLLAPTGVSATDGTYTDKVYITWNSVTGASYYRVYKATSANGTPILIADWRTALYYYDCDVTPGTFYYYFVRAATSNTGANISAYSNYNKGYAKLPPVTTLPAPTGVTAIFSTQSKNIMVNWNSVSGAFYYKVYRAVYYINAPKIAITNWQSSTHYDDDDDFSMGEICYYWIKAARTSSGANASNYSDVASAMALWW